MKLHRIALSTLILSLAAACGDDDDPMTGGNGGTNPEEFITTFNVTFSAAGEMIMASLVDPDADGPMNPEQTDPTAFTENTTYTISLEFLDEQDPADVEDITAEIREEAEEHLVVYQVGGDVGTVAITDVESDYENGNTVGDDLPVGLAAEFTTGASGSTGTLLISLRHLPPNGDTPQKTATSGLTDGDTDVQATFPIMVQ